MYSCPEITRVAARVYFIFGPEYRKVTSRLNRQRYKVCERDDLSDLDHTSDSPLAIASPISRQYYAKRYPERITLASYGIKKATNLLLTQGSK